MDTELLPQGPNIIPTRARVLSGSALKLIACATMLVDHVALHLLRFMVPHFMEPTVMLPFAVAPLSAYALCRGVGRIAMPLFCFLLVEGAVHTHDRLRYGARLAASAVISELAWDLEHTGALLDWSSQSVMVTLLLGYVALCGAEHFKGNPALQIACALPSLGIAAVAHADYGVVGVGLILALYVLRSHACLRAAAGILVEYRDLRTLPAYALMALYNGERGFASTPALKAAFYAFYPVHLFIIAGLKMWLGYV